jgi:hypothetical protein
MGNGLQYTFNERDNRALGRLHFWGMVLAFDFHGLGVLLTHYYDFYDIRYPAETGCFGTIWRDWHGNGNMAFLEGMAFGLFSSDSRFGRSGVYSIAHNEMLVDGHIIFSLSSDSLLLR